MPASDDAISPGFRPTPAKRRLRATATAGAAGWRTGCGHGRRRRGRGDHRQRRGPMANKRQGDHKGCRDLTRVAPGVHELLFALDKPVYLARQNGDDQNRPKREARDPADCERDQADQRAQPVDLGESREDGHGQAEVFHGPYHSLEAVVDRKATGKGADHVAPEVVCDPKDKECERHAENTPSDTQKKPREVYNPHEPSVDNR